MSGFAHDGNGIELVFSKNVDFSGGTVPTAQILTDAQMLIGTTAVNAGGTHIDVGTLTSTGGTLAITYSSPNINLEVTGGLFSWSAITASQTLAINHGYFCVSAGGALSLLLPVTSSRGDVIEIALNGATSFTITQSAGQSIRIGNMTSTAGVAGSLASTQQGDWLRLVCMTANLTWMVLGVEGNITVV